MIVRGAERGGRGGGRERAGEMQEISQTSEQVARLREWKRSEAIGLARSSVCGEGKR
jgi:hypothetical protein